jgi:hypothetical protein
VAEIAEQYKLTYKIGRPGEHSSMCLSWMQKITTCPSVPLLMPGSILLGGKTTTVRATVVLNGSPSHGTRWWAVGILEGRIDYGRER